MEELQAEEENLKELEGWRRGIGREAPGINFFSYYHIYMVQLLNYRLFITNDLLVTEMKPQLFQTTLEK